eukprot:2877586-Prymnesium_polylepis.1
MLRHRLTRTYDRQCRVGTLGAEEHVSHWWGPCDQSASDDTFAGKATILRQPRICRAQSCTRGGTINRARSSEWLAGGRPPRPAGAGRD